MSKPETRLQSKIQKALEARGAWVLKVHGSPFTKRGTPDLLICYRGRFVAMEVKIPGQEKNTTELQEYRLKEIKEAGGICFVVSSVEFAKNILNAIDMQIFNK